MSKAYLQDTSYIKFSIHMNKKLRTGIPLGILVTLLFSTNSNTFAFGYSAPSTIISSNSLQQQIPNTISEMPSISGNGKFAIFVSSAHLTTESQTIPYVQGVYVKNLDTNAIILVSKMTNGSIIPTTISSSTFLTRPMLSDDGRYAIFGSPFETSSGVAQYRKDLVTGVLERVSVYANGTVSEGDIPSMSSDGRYISFISPNTLTSTDLKPSKKDIYVRDMTLGTTRLVTTNSVGIQSVNGDIDSNAVNSISPDGTLVEFSSYANDLVPGDINGSTDVFIKNLITDQTTRISLNNSGVQGNGYSGYNLDYPNLRAFSADNKYVLFNSEATNLTSDIVGGNSQLFLRDLTTNTNTLISKNPTTNVAGIKASGASDYSISADGTRIIFSSYELYLDPSATAPTMANNPVSYLYDRASNTMHLLSIALNGTDLNSNSLYVDISNDGSRYVFQSNSSKIVPTDSNPGPSDTDIFFVNNSPITIIPVTAPVVVPTVFIVAATKSQLAATGTSKDYLIVIFSIVVTSLITAGGINYLRKKQSKIDKL